MSDVLATKVRELIATWRRQAKATGKYGFMTEAAAEAQNAREAELESCADELEELLKSIAQEKT